ncbi:hypothetical protein MUP77_06180, partial [Candidatus Bathyarchaeota archaeon]|nr:hypothetical protein [Candidatus Bathyarchaeota archaeon]
MLKRFSERKGLTKTRTIAQVDSIDDQLRNGLWDMLTVVYWKQAGDSFGLNRLLSLADAFWHSYFKEPLDTRPAHWGDIWSRLRDYFFGCLWYCVYDFIEFTANTHSDEQSNKRFTEACNRILEREQSAYRFVGKQIVQITSKDEIATIEEALGTPFKTVQIHFKSASRMMSDRKSPD